VRERFVDTRLGRFALTARGALETLIALYSRPENIGVLINDQIATSLLVRLCRENKSFIDVGAHIGSIVSQVAYHGPSIKIVAIEPIPGKVANLRRRFANIEVIGCALGDTDLGEIAFFIHKKRSGYSSLIKPRQDADTIEIKVPLRKLDNLISPSDSVDVIKIDVEGAELGVLRGSENLISRNRPVVMFESGPVAEHDFGYSKEDMWRWWNERAYELLLPNRVAHDGSGMSLDCFLDAHVYPRHTTNYFAVPTERRIEIRDRARVLNKVL